MGRTIASAAVPWANCVSEELLPFYLCSQQPDSRHTATSVSVILIFLKVRLDSQ
jgi:hypothetical protein